MRDQINAAAYKSAHGRLPPAMHLLQRASAQGKHRRVIHEPAAQAIHRPVHAQAIVQLRLGHFPVRAAINKRAVCFLNGLNGAGVALVILDTFAHAKSHPAQRRIFLRVHSYLACSRVQHLHTAFAGFHHRTQPQLGLGLTYPALANSKGAHDPDGANRRCGLSAHRLSSASTAGIIPQAMSIKR